MLTRACVFCTEKMKSVEYPLTDKYRADWNEWKCEDCNRRIGRWCQTELRPHMVEPMFCSGEGHPRVYKLDEERTETTSK